MATAAVLPPTDPQPPAALSEPQRILDTFIAPTKTFTDLRRSAAWWGPFILIVVVSYLFIYAVDQKVTFQTVVDNAIKMQPKAQARMESVPPEKRQQVMQQQVTITKYISYSVPGIALLIYLVFAAVIFAAIKFGANADVGFGVVFALIVYTRLPELLRALLSSLSLFAGASTDSFDINNPLAANGAYFMDPSSSPILRAFVGSFDVITLWTLVLVAIGIPCIAPKVKRGTAFAIVIGWFIFTILIKVGLASLSA